MENQDSSENTATSAPIQNVPARTGGNQLTTALIVIIVVLLFVMLLFTMNGKMFQSGSTSDGEVTALKSRNTQLRAEINAERASRGLPPLPENANSARAMAERIQRDATSLASMTGQWQTELEKKDEILRAREGEIAGHTQNAQRLYAQITALQAQLDLQKNAADQIVRLNNDLKIAQNQIITYNKQLQEFQGRPTNEQVTTLRKQLNESLDARNKLELELDKLKDSSKNVVNKKMYDDLAEELKNLRPQISEQRYEIQRLRSLLDRARLFIESEKDLPVIAARLFEKLKTLEDVNEQQLKAAYTNIETTLGARIIHRQEFATGSAQITFNREAMIKNAMGHGANADSFFLVVGYASKTGDAKSNKTLSADRATTAASVVNLLKTPQQDVRAVYLGQTARFDRTNHTANQICEVWEIKR